LSFQTLDATTADTKLLFLCSPGNPTSKAFPLADIEALASSNRYGGIVVVDEAYVDFSSKGSAISLISKYPNIVVLQTLSKAFGLAGIRCGFCLGSPDVIQLMNNVKAPYNMNSLTTEVAMNALNNIKTLEKNIAALLMQRTIVERALKELDFCLKVYPSDANFILFRVKKNAKDIYKAMADGGVVTRYRGTEMHCDECIRVTVGTPEENKIFLARLAETYRALDH
jgi:histidinol-phosphate aminotransferase